MNSEYLKEKFAEIEILKGKLLTYPKECRKEIISKLCCICEEIESYIYSDKNKKSQKMHKCCKNSKKHTRQVCECKCEENKKKNNKWDRKKLSDIEE